MTIAQQIIEAARETIATAASPELSGAEDTELRLELDAIYIRLGEAARIWEGEEV